MAGLAIWLQALIAFGSALIVAWVSLLYRYRQRGHPFGSLAAAKWAIPAIAITAAPATVALLLPRVPPAYLGVAVPALLAVRGSRLHEQRKPTEDAYWFRIATLGVRLLLDHLKTQMETDRDDWVKPYVEALSNIELMEYFAENLYSALEGRSSMKSHMARLRSSRNAVRTAAQQAETAREDRQRRQAIHSAKQAVTRMLQLTHDCGQQSAARIQLPPGTSATAVQSLRRTGRS